MVKGTINAVINGPPDHIAMLQPLCCVVTDLLFHSYHPASFMQDFLPLALILILIVMQLIHFLY